MWNLQNDKKQIEDFGISKYQNKNLHKFRRRKAHTSFSCLWNFTQKIEDPKMTRRKLKTLELQNTKTKDL